MSGEQVPGEIREFILRYINSIAQLEALLLLRREPEGNWDATSMAQRLYVSEQHARGILTQLCADGLVSLSEGTYHFSAPDQKELVASLAEIYARQLIPVTNIIHEKPLRIQEFAEAFKLRKDS